MAIKGLWKLYLSKIGYEVILLSSFKGKRIAVDAFSIMYETRSVAKTRYIKRINPLTDIPNEDEVDKIWLDMLLNVIIGYMMCGVTPILVFDSGRQDEMKAGTIKKRVSYADSYLQKYQSLSKAYKDIDRSIVPINVINECATLLAKINLMPSNSLSLAKWFLKEIGLPYASCIGEAERTCSLMNNCGLVSAIISPDSDSLCCGAKIVLKEKCEVIENNSSQKAFKAARLDSILAALNISFDLFQDMCIMSGTDFNQNIKGISLMKSYKMLKTYGSFEEVAKTRDVSCINRDEVKKMFTIIPWEETVKNCSIEFGATNLEAFKTYDLEHLQELFDRLKQECISLTSNAKEDSSIKLL